MESTEILVKNLTHHVKLRIDKGKPQSTTKISPLDEEEDVDVVTPAADPFTEINVAEVNNRGKVILEYMSDHSSSDDELPTTLSNTWRSYELDNSDDESAGSGDEEDVLKHAGIYTIDEVATISKNKMQRLQSLYIDQFQRLQYVLREKRRCYLQAVKKEKEVYSNINDQLKDSPKERKLYNKLKALNHHHKRFGTESLLYRQFMEKRLRQNEQANLVPHSQQSKNIPKCNFSEGGVKCTEPSIPCCKFCRKHILEDKKQVLFKNCGIEKSGIVCQEPVGNIFEDSTCILHTAFPLPKVYVKRKYESETEEDENECESYTKVEIKEELQETTLDSSVVEASFGSDAAAAVVAMDSNEVNVD